MLKEKSKKEITEKAIPAGRYFEAVGRRKTAVARVRIFPTKQKGEFIVNNADVLKYFPTNALRHIVHRAQEKAKAGQWTVSVRVMGGGIHAQAEAVRHGISRALVKFDENLRKPLKREGMLRRDPRAKERKKFGLKKARKRAQWSKR